MEQQMNQIAVAARLRDEDLKRLREEELKRLREEV
jgi:hypothetical protein